MSGSNSTIDSTRSSNSSIRIAVSAEIGNTSTVSPRARKRPRDSATSFLSYWTSTSCERSRSRPICPPCSTCTASSV
ncbi:MAG: hypothetical protein HY815_13390 [Candidatus Riflebacteria bacterium]|nr:hypothetical protein [Candidatus Riflebacteria bacterium]